MQRIRLPSGQIANFPDEMSREDIEAVLQKQFPVENGDKSKSEISNQIPRKEKNIQTPNKLSSSLLPENLQPGIGSKFTRGLGLGLGDIVKQISTPGLMKLQESAIGKSPFSGSPITSTGELSEEAGRLVGSGVLPGGVGAKVESALMPYATNFLTRSLARGAGGAAAAASMKQNPLVGGFLSTVLGVPGEVLNKLSIPSKLSTLYRKVASLSDTKENSSTLFKDQIKNYLQKQKNASDLYKSLDANPEIKQVFEKQVGEPGMLGFGVTDKPLPTTFKDKANQLIEDLGDVKNSPEKKKLKSFIQGYNNKSINSFEDLMNTDKQLNKDYGDLNMHLLENKNLKSKYAQLKEALKTHMDDLEDLVPESLKNDYQAAKNAYKEKTYFETIPNSTEVSPFFKRYKKQLNPEKVASGEIEGNTKGYLGEYLKPSSGQASYNPQTEHIFNITSPEHSDKILASYIDKFGTGKITRKKMLNALNSLTEKQQQYYDGLNPGVLNEMKSLLSKRGTYNSLKISSKLLGILEGTKIGHPFMGYAAGSELADRIYPDEINLKEGKNSPVVNPLNFPYARYGAETGALEKNKDN